MKTQTLAAVLIAAALTQLVPAPAVAVENAAVQPVVVYYPGGQFTPAQVAALQPDQINGLATAVVQQELTIMGTTRLNENGEAMNVPAANRTAAVRYARANRDAFYAVSRLLVDVNPPDITPGNINDPSVITEINRAAQANARNAAMRRAIDAAVTAIARPVGYCNVLDCGRD